MSASAESGRRSGSLVPLTLALLVIASAVAVVEIKQQSRDLTTHIEQMRDHGEALDREQAKLQLEDATLASHGRIEQLARQQGMVEPKHYVIVEGGR